MAKLLFDRKTRQITLTPLCEFDGSISRRQVQPHYRELVDALKLGRFCVVAEGHVNGMHRDTTSRIFQVGKRGLVAIGKKDSKLLGIDVLSQENAASQSGEQVVLEEGCLGRRFLHSMPVVSLTTRGVSHMSFYNEGTFSPAGGTWINHPIGDYIDSIVLGQRKIKRDFPQHVRELELRMQGIPFTLPHEYLATITRGIKFGDIRDAVALEAMSIFTAEELLEDMDDPRGGHACPYKFGTPQHKGFWTRYNHQVKEFERISKQRKALFEKLKHRCGLKMAENMTLNAVAGSLEEHFDIFRSRGEEKYRVTEVNHPYEHNKSGNLIRMPKRGFSLVPSRLMPNVVYAIPDDRRSSDFLLESLRKFNSRYPDTVHIPDAKENYVPQSISLAPTGVLTH
jgi:hypothetical protein